MATAGKKAQRISLYYIPQCDASLVDYVLHPACRLVVRIGDPRVAALYRGCANPTLGVCYDDSASAAERRSASKAMQLEGSLHRLLTAEGLPACPVSLAGPATSPCPQLWCS